MKNSSCRSHTGMVGEIMLKVLAERNFPVTELIPSERSVGKEIDFKGQNILLLLQTAVDMKADIALFSAVILH
jgi:aspartate-semialdehyde dehydrogenase